MRNLVKARLSGGIWTTNLITLAVTVFCTRLGQGLMSGASTNFFVDVIGLSGSQVLWLAGIREIPGLALMFIAALMHFLPLSRRATVSLALMGIGYGLYSVVNSYAALIAMALVASLGFHNWNPVQNSLGLAMAKKEESGRVLGNLASVGSLASILGMGFVAVLSVAISLRTMYALAGVLIVVASVVVARIPKNVGEYGDPKMPRVLLKRKFWLYYALVFFEGSRTQVFGTFGTLVLVQYYNLKVGQVSALLALSGLLNFVLAPRMGRLIDRFGERIVLSASYVGLALCFIGYATVHQAWFLALMLLGINLLVTLRIGLSSYVNRMASKEELTPTLSAGVSINHITSVGMSFVAGSLLQSVGYEWLCVGAAAIIVLSIPFAMAMRVERASLSVVGTPGK